MTYHFIPLYLTKNSLSTAFISYKSPSFLQCAFRFPCKKSRRLSLSCGFPFLCYCIFCCYLSLSFFGNIPLDEEAYDCTDNCGNQPCKAKLRQRDRTYEAKRHAKARKYFTRAHNKRKQCADCCCICVFFQRVVHKCHDNQNHQRREQHRKEVRKC